MTATEGDVTIFIVIVIASVWYYYARTALFRDRYFPLPPPERKFRSTSKRNTVDVKNEESEESEESDEQTPIDQQQ